MTPSFEIYLKPTWFVESELDAVAEFCDRHARGADPRERAVSLYYAIRDGYRYNPYLTQVIPEKFRTRAIIHGETGHCIDKANILIACARHIGIPARFSFYNVRNHIGTDRLEKILGTNLLVFHGCAELYLGDKWVKATPAFNRELCERLGVEPLEFDGREDSIFQAYDREKGTFMEYVHDYGSFHEIPWDYMVGEWKRYYSGAAVALN